MVDYLPFCRIIYLLEWCVAFDSVEIVSFTSFSAQCVRQNESLRYCHDVHPSVRQSIHLSGMGMHCDYTVHFSMDLSLQLDSPMLWALAP